MTDLKIYCLTGFTGSGKTTVANILIEKYPNSFELLTSGDIPRKILQERQIEPTHQNLQNITNELVKLYGSNFISLLFKDFMPKKRRIIIDSIRRPEDIACLSSNFQTIKILSIVCENEIRFKRLFNRKRIGDPKTNSDLDNMNLLETIWGIPSLIAGSDYSIINNDSILELNLKIEKFINSL